ncbi:MAG: permease [Alphaproteobacteria bacterium]|nr:permease [Alphaproteobacteria bacterium]
MTVLALKQRLQTVKIDRVWIALVLGFALLAIVDPQQVRPSAEFTVEALISIAIFIAIAVGAAAYLQASSADGLIAKAFSGSPVRTIVVASLVGAMSPFCSCGVVPLIAAMLAAGVPLAPVMAFWLASPVMDPEIYVLTSAAIGVEFATVKLLGAVLLGMFGGGITHLVTSSGGWTDILKMKTSGCCKASLRKEINWTFWTERKRRQAFVEEGGNNALFLLKWLTLAFFLESLMVTYIPGELIASYLGGDEWYAIPLAVFAGMPAYLNGYAAIPLVSGLLDLGMDPGAALAFMTAGSVSSIPAAVAVWALVRFKVFAVYVALGLTGSLLTGWGYAAYLAA